MFKPTKVIDRKTPSAKMNEETNQNIQVFVRCRPLNLNEKKALIDVIPEKRSIRTIQHNKLYSFDNVFDDKAKQLDVYRSVVEPLVEQVIEGYNCTVFAYGQTGTGKTFTMVGDRTDNKISWEEDPLSGIIPRAIDQLLDELQHQNTEYTIRVSFLELYNEEAYDLLSALSDTGKLRIYNDSERKGSVIISGLVEMIVQTKAEIFEILEKGSLKRQTAPTLMNACSSRSHSIFSITVHIKEIAFDGEEVVKMGKLNLVDLAGSENIGRSGAVEERAREASNINKSLLTLGRVITSLVEKSSHIPYRDSKLTRLLQDSLGGKTKTSIIATISPCNDDLEDTISTLDYAQRAKKITNKPEINLKMSKKTLINEYLAEIDRLRRDLEANRDKKGIYVDAKNYALMEAMVKSQEQGLEEKEAQIENMKKELENYSTILSKTNEDLGIKCQELENTREKLEELSNYLEKTKEILKETEKEVENCKVVIDAHKKTEVKLLKKAETVVNVADKCVDDNEKLYHKVDTFGSLENQNSVSLKMFQENSIKQLKNIRSLNDVISSDLAEGKGSIEKLIENVEPEIESKNVELKTNFEKMKNNIEKFAFVMMESLERNNDNNDTKSTINICSLLDDFKTSLSEELAQFSESLKENGTENDHILDELCQESIKNRSHLEESIMAQSSRINEFSKHINLMVHSCDDLSKQIHNDKSKEFEQFSKDIAEIKKQVDNMDLNQRLERMEKEHKEKLIEMEMMFTRSLSTVKTEYQEKLKSFSTVLDDFQNRVQTLMANDLENRDQQSFKYQELIRSVCKYEKENFALLSELDTRNNQSCESSVQKYDQIRKIRRKLADHFQRFQSKNETNMEEYFGKIDEKIHAIIDEIIVSTCKSTKDIESNQSIADEISDKIHDTLERILSELKQIESKCQALNFSQEFQLNEFTKMVKNLEINYKKYQTTGCTPKRSKFWYPKTFTPTSPHDRIIARYRQEYSTNNVVDGDIDQYPCDDFKEELNFESDSPSPSSESDESPSSSSNNSISSCGENLENNNKMATNNQLMKPPSGSLMENNAKKLLNDTVTVVSSATNDRTICMRRLLKEKN